MKVYVFLGALAGAILMGVCAGLAGMITVMTYPSNNTRQMCHELKRAGYLDDACFDELGITLACINGRKTP